MINQEIKLTKTDRAILESYRLTIDGLADYLGDSYEFVLHSLENLDQSVIKIVNGFHTGRTEGAPITNLALTMLEKISSEEGKNSNCYFTKNKKGEPLKSSTIVIRGTSGNPIGLLCINFYLNTPINSWIGGFVERNEEMRQRPIKENFSETVNELIIKTYEEVRVQVENDLTILPSLKNKRIIELLYDRGIFKIKNSAMAVSKLMGISRNTVYLHLRNAKA